MNILICPDKFKGSLSSKEVCDTLAEGIMSSYANCNIINHPMADGGDGSVEILKSFLDLKEILVQTVDPIEREIEAKYHVSNDAAFIELAKASGITLLEEENRNPLFTSTRGTGLLIRDALNRGLKKIYLFIGGSATNDGGIGILQALGFELLSHSNEPLTPIGKSLNEIEKVVNNQHFNFDEIEIKVLCDVTNPMYGPNGAAHIYGKQKGAADEDIIQLDAGLQKYALSLRKQFGKDLSSIPGLGAAGAVGASLLGVLNAEIHKGFQLLAQITDLENSIISADLVITGEGKVDQTSFSGKVVGNVLSICQEHKKPCGIIGGIVDDLGEKESLFLFRKSVISHALNFNDAMISPKKYLFEIGKEIGILIN